MADLNSYLAILDSDPDDAAAFAGLADAAANSADANAFARAKKTQRDRGRYDVVVRLIDVELGATADPARRADLMLEKGMVLEDDLLDEASATRCFEAVLALRPGDEVATENLEQIQIDRDNWEKFATKYLDEAKASTDRQLSASLYLSAAEIVARHQPDSQRVEEYLRKALEIDGKNRKAAMHLERVLRKAERWDELTRLLNQRADAAATREERVAALISLADVLRASGDADHAREALSKAITLDAGHPVVVRLLAELFATAERWVDLVSLYQGALRARRGDGDDLGLLLQVGMIQWKRLEQLDAAEESFRRIRKSDPTHPAALDFYRAYYPSRNETAKLLQMLRQAEKQLGPSRDPVAQARGRALSLEIAELAEAQVGNQERAIEAWKQFLRADPASQEAREALKRLYRKGEKWNALLDLMKDDIDRLPDTDVLGRVDRMFELVEIYRDRLKLDGMVINTYNAILKLDPDNRRAVDELAERYRVMARWNDLIATLTKKSELAAVPVDDRIKILREIADLWIERFGNFAQAIRPLERLLELSPRDADAIVKLKDIYTRRRQWRALIGLLGREAEAEPIDKRRDMQAEMARLAMERVGDQRLAIEIWNQVLAEAEPGAELPDVWAALAGLYEREKRWLALAEALRRQRELAKAPKEAVALLERLGGVFADRLGAPGQAAAIWQEILALDPNHGKALRTLRELLAQAQDWDGLEQLYGKLGQDDELVDALVVIADRSDDRRARAAIMERAALLAQRRSKTAKRGDGAEREVRVWERLLAVEPQHALAARELAPVYRKQEKWARLLPVLEVVLAHTEDRAGKLGVIAEIRALSEYRLGSKSLAFTWSARGFELAPTDEPLRGELIRLAHDKEQVAELIQIFDRHASDDKLPAPTRLALLRELGKLAAQRLGDPERARGYWGRVAQLAPEDPDAVGHLEELAAQVSDWPALLASRRRRAERTADPVARAQLVVELATIEENRLADLDAAVASYQQALSIAPEGEPIRLIAIRALARLNEARGDWDGLVTALRGELAATTDDARRFALLMRIGGLEENSLGRPEVALADYLDAFAIPDRDGPRREATDALIRYLDNTAVPAARRIDVAALLRPVLEQRADVASLARALEVIRLGDPARLGGATAIDLRLLELYLDKLGDPARGWDVGLRLIAAEPADKRVRRALLELSGILGRDGELLGHLQSALTALQDRSAPSGEIRELAVELARFAGDRLGDRGAEEQAWKVVLAVDPTAAEAFDALTEQYRADQRWPELRALLDRRAEISLDDRARKTALIELAQLDEDAINNPVNAVSSHRRILEVDPTYLPSYKAIARLLEAAGSWAELDDVLARQIDHDDKGAVGLRFRRAELAVRHLANPIRAVDLLEEVVRRQPGHADARELLEELLGTAAAAPAGVDAAQRVRIARVLEPLYQADKLWKDLVLVLRIQRTAAAGPAEAVELLARIADLEENELDAARGAFDTWTAALAVDPTDERVRTAIPRLAQALDRWEDAARAWESAAAAAPDAVTKAGLYAELGEFYDVHLEDGDRAIVAYQYLLEADPTGPETNRKAGAALARLFEEEERWPELRDILRRQADWTESPDDRPVLLARVAVIEETRLDDRSAAIAAWREVLAEEPDDATAIESLDRLYQTDGRWNELIEVARRRVERAGHPSTKKMELRRIASIHEQRLDNAHDAISAHLEILDHLPDDEDTLNELARLYRKHGRHADLLDVLERRLASGTGNAAEIQIEIATMLDGPLGRPSEALERWADVLEADPTQAQALAAVRSALDDPGLQVRAAAILGPLYEATGQDAERAALLERLAEADDEPRERIRHLREVAQLREHRLGDRDGALSATLRALAGAAGEPDLPELIGEAERLASDLGREGDLIDVYRQLAPDVLDADLQRRLYLDVADLARGVRGDLELAREHYQKVLDGQPDDLRSLLALESLAREAGDHRRLYELLSRKAELAGGDVDERVAALAESAQLAGSVLRRHDDAVNSWLAVLDLAPERHDAVAALDALYREQARWHDLVDLYERRLGFATTIEEAVALRVALAELHERRLYDLEGALENYSAALGGDPDHPAALAAVERFLDEPQVRAGAAEVLEPQYVATQDWPKLVRVYEVKLDVATEPEERLRLTKFVARLFEEQLEDFDGAMRWYARIFRENPGDHAVRDQLSRLAAVSDGWQFLAQVYQAYLDDEPGDSEETRDVALALASIYERRIGDLDKAQAAYRRALATGLEQSTNDDREILRRLEGVLIRAGRWPTLAEIYDQVLGGGCDDQVRRELFAKKARLYERELGDPSRAVDAWREVLLLAEDEGAAPDGAPPSSSSGGSGFALAGAKGRAALAEAETELERLYRAGARWHDLADLLAARLERADDPAAQIELRLRLAGVRETELHDPTTAIEQYEEVLALPGGPEKALPHLERLVVRDDHREHIADLLEPIYRQRDWWQKLVVILDAKLAYVDDPMRRVEMLREIARLHETRGGDPDLALSALARAWREDVGNGELLDELSQLAGKLGAWDELIGILEEGGTSTLDTEALAMIGTRIAEVHEAHRSDLPAAIAAWRKVLEARSDDLPALAALDRLLAVEGRTDELVKVVERRAELADDAGIRLVLLHRVAALYEEVLERPSDAIGAYKNVLGVDDSDLAALDGLERLYTAAAEHRELADVLRRKIELTTEVPERRRLRLVLAAVAADQLRDPYDAIGNLQAALEEDAGDEEALIGLEKIHQRERMWPELLEILDRRALLETDSAARAELAYRAARLVERELADPEAAIPRFGAALQITPAHEGARDALAELAVRDDLVEPATAILERVYRADRDAAGLIRVYERRLQLAGLEPGLRRAQWIALSEVHETMKQDERAAFDTWARAFADDPSDLELLGPLERLARTNDRWTDLAALLDQQLAEQPGGDVEHQLAMKLGVIAEDMLGDLARAAAAFERAAATRVDERAALTALERVYARASRWTDLATTLARQADAAGDDGAAAEYEFRLADLRETTLRDPLGAVAAYREALVRAPNHGATRAALDRLLRAGLVELDNRRPAPDGLPEVVEVLEPLYEQDSDWGRLADVVATRLHLADPVDRAALCQRLVELADRRLGDRDRAYLAAVRWIAEEPGSGEAFAEAERLADVRRSHDAFSQDLLRIIDAVRDEEDRKALLLQLGRIQLDKLGNASGAATSFAAVLEIEPDHLGAVESAARALRQQGDAAALAKMEWRRGELALEPAVKRAAFTEAAELFEDLGDLDAAARGWEASLEVEDNDRPALDRLARIHERRGDHAALIDVLRRAAEQARDITDEKGLLIRIAQLQGKQGDAAAAVRAWQAVLDVDPSDAAVLAELEAAHTRGGDWLAVQEILTRRLDLAQGNSDRLAILAQMARLAEDRRGSVDDAIAHWFGALDVDPSSTQAYDELERLLAAGGRWHDLVDLLEKRAELEGTLGRGDHEIRVLARAADVWEQRLDNPDAAGEILEKILRREPGSVAALTRLSRIYERNGDWDRCSKVLEQALALGPRGTDAADLFYRLGEVARRGTGDPDTAQAHFRQALVHDTAHLASIAALETLARERGDGALLADMLRRRLASGGSSDRRAALLELAELERRAGRPDAAIPLLSEAANGSPDDAQILGPLADLYVAAGRHEEAAPILAKLADEARAARRMKDVAKFRQRQGAILEARGDAAGALSAYEEAFRVNPTDVPTMAGLGRLYMQARDWEKARRVYRSLVLQNIDADAGLSKGDVYWALGVIHVELGEAPKAKGMFQRGLEIEPGHPRLREALNGLG
jgi:tetratricopeptide (TPR) repeat protein